MYASAYNMTQRRPRDSNTGKRSLGEGVGYSAAKSNAETIETDGCLNT